MRKMSFVRYAAAAAIAGSAAFVVVLPGSVAGAAKGPLTETCTDVVGTMSAQLVSGCSGDSKATAEGVVVPGALNGNTVDVTLTWLSKKFDTQTVTVGVENTDACPVLGSTAASAEESESSVVTGGNDKLTQGVAHSADACLYAGSTGDYSLIITGLPGQNSEFGG